MEGGEWTGLAKESLGSESLLVAVGEHSPSSLPDPNLGLRSARELQDSHSMQCSAQLLTSSSSCFAGTAGRGAGL